MNEEITNVIDKLKKPENFNYYTNYGWAHSLSICDADTIIKYVEKLQNNWNELKRWLEENKFNDNYESYQVDNYTTYNDILNKMQKMEGNNEK